MRYYVQVCLLFAFAAGSLLQAHSACVPCNVRVEVGAEAISFRPRICDQRFLIHDDRTIDTILAQTDPEGHLLRPILPSGRLSMIDCNFNWGWRVFAAYVSRCTCVDARAQYTWLHGVDHTRPPGFIDRQVFWPAAGSPKHFDILLVNGTPNTAQAPFDAFAAYKTDYDTLDLELGWRGLSTCYYWLRLFGGLHLLHLENSFECHYEGYTPAGFALAPDQNFNANVLDKQRNWAIGPRLGLEGQAEVYFGFGISGRFAVGILADENRGKHLEFGTAFPIAAGAIQPIDFKDDRGSRSRVVPFVNLRIGVSHVWCCGANFLAVGEVGYEFLSYMGILHRFTFNDTAGTGSSVCPSFNMDGFYFSIRLVL